MDVFEVESCVRGHHIYKQVLTPFIGEELTCTREIENTKDPFAVAVVRHSTVVGHVPWKDISRMCPVLSKEGTIQSKVTGSKLMAHLNLAIQR